MRKKTIVVLNLCGILLLGAVAGAQEKAAKKSSEKSRNKATIKIRPEHRLRASERELEKIEEELERAQLGLEPLQHFEMPDIDIELPDLEKLQIELSELQIPSIEIPPIEIPEIAIPPIELDFDGLYALGELSALQGELATFGWQHDLSDDEQLRLQALRSLARQDEEQFFATLSRILQKDASPAVRFEAVRLLRKYLDRNAAIDLLEQAAQHDANVRVRKKAIQLLGKSGSPRAFDILQNLVKKQK